MYPLVTKKGPFLLVFLFLMCMGVLPACMYVKEDPKRALDALELELQMVVSHNVDAEN